jgi:hypothetical protein
MPFKNNHTHSKNVRKQNQIFSEKLNISTPCRYTYYIYITMQKGCLHALSIREEIGIKRQT